jgi:RHS repeat-associated protein
VGSVRQLADANAQVVLARGYTPYGEPLWMQGTASSRYAFTGEDYDTYIKLLFLRTRYYSPYLNQFIQPDILEPDSRIPADWNRCLYVRDNPVNYTDPTGKSICYKPLRPLPASCQIGLANMYGSAAVLKGQVESGALEPVEAFAMFADLSKTQFDEDFPGMLWAMTLVLNDFDANRGMVWTQISDLHLAGEANSPYFIKQDWLPYKHNPSYDQQNWIPGQPWIHSLRGDWNKNYWDKTANQAYHFWFYVATTYFDGGTWANLANFVHDGFGWENYDYISSRENEAPPPSGKSKPDYDLAIQGMLLGSELVKEDILEVNGDQCDISGSFDNRTDIGTWIRNHLKE